MPLVWAEDAADAARAALRSAAAILIPLAEALAPDTLARLAAQHYDPARCVLARHFGGLPHVPRAALLVVEQPRRIGPAPGVCFGVTRLAMCCAAPVTEARAPASATRLHSAKLAHSGLRGPAPKRLPA